MCFGTDNTQARIAARAQRDEKQRQKRVTTGMAKINGAFDRFNPAYFESRGKQFFDFAAPGLMNTFRNSRDKLTFGLARSGNIGPGGQTSSTAISKNADLYTALNSSRQALAGRGFDFAASERAALEGTRSGLVSELRATADPTAAVAAANHAASTFASRPMQQPTADLFTNLTAIGADVAQPPIDWRQYTKGLQLTPRASSSVRVVS